MSKAPTHDQASGALDTQQQPVTGSDFPAEAITAASRFYGPSNPRQARVLDALLTGARLTNNDVRRIAGCLNGPDVIDRLRDQGLCDVTELAMDWIKTIDRDGRHVRYGEYYLTPKGLAKVQDWEASQVAEADA